MGRGKLLLALLAFQECVSSPVLRSIFHVPLPFLQISLFPFSSRFFWHPKKVPLSPLSPALSACPHFLNMSEQRSQVLLWLVEILRFRLFSCFRAVWTWLWSAQGSSWPPPTQVTPAVLCYPNPASDAQYKYSQWGVKNVLTCPPGSSKALKHSSVIQKEIANAAVAKWKRKYKIRKKKGVFFGCWGFFVVFVCFCFA